MHISSLHNMHNGYYYYESYRAVCECLHVYRKSVHESTSVVSVVSVCGESVHEGTAVVSAVSACGKSVHEGTAVVSPGGGRV